MLRSAPSCSPTAAGHNGIVGLLFKDLMELVGIRGEEFDGPRSKRRDQVVADRSCLRKLARGGVTSSEPEEASRQAYAVRQVVETICNRSPPEHRATRMKAIMAEAKQRGWYG